MAWIFENKPYYNFILSSHLSIQKSNLWPRARESERSYHFRLWLSFLTHYPWHCLKSFKEGRQNQSSGGFPLTATRLNGFIPNFTTTTTHLFSSPVGLKHQRTTPVLEIDLICCRASGCPTSSNGSSSCSRDVGIWAGPKRFFFVFVFFCLPAIIKFCRFFGWNISWMKIGY